VRSPDASGNKTAKTRGTVTDNSMRKDKVDTMPGTAWKALTTSKDHRTSLEPRRDFPDRGESWNAVQHDRHRKA
jgi:hypothetical protein